jgi:hypothetical protein
MTTMTQAIPRTHSLKVPACIAFFWIVAAMLVMAAHAALDRTSSIASAVATLAVILGAAYGYTRLIASRAGVTHALSVGITWLVLSIVAELTIAARLGHGWFTLIGSPQHPLLRNVCLFVWIFAPGLFATADANKP